jgi:phosphonate transport system substrate-binding protein
MTVSLRLSIGKGILLLVLAWLPFPEPVSADTGPPLQFAIFPYVDPATLIDHQRPLKLFLEQSLHRLLIMQTAPDFDAFIQRTLAGDYDLILAAPHMARYAELEGRHQRIAMSLHQVQGVILARADAAIEELADLRGKTIAAAEPQALLHQMLLQILLAHDLQPGRDLRLLLMPSHNNALLAVLHGSSDAALTAILLWRRLNDSDKRQLTVLQETQAIAGVMLMAHPRFTPDQLSAIRAAVEAFSHSPQSEGYFFKGGFTAISEDAMRSLDPYLQIWEKNNQTRR